MNAIKHIGKKLTADSIRRFGAKMTSNVQHFGKKLSTGINRAGDFAQRALPVVSAAAELIPGGRAFVPLIHSVNDKIKGFRQGYDKLNNMIQSA